MRSVWPAVHEYLVQHGVLRGGFDQPSHVVRVRVRFLSGDESRAHADARRANLEQLGGSSCGTDPTRGENRDINAGESLGKDIIETLPAAHVATGLDALSHDEVAPDLDRRTRLGRGSDLPPDDRVVGTRKSHELLIRVAVEELNNLDRGTGGLDSLRNDKRDKKTNSDRLIGSRSRVVNQLLHLGRGGGVRDHPQAAGFGDSRG